MKRVFMLVLLAVGLISCTQEPLDSIKEESIGKPMTFNISVADTKAAKTDWANTDKIYVFFNGLATKYLILEYDGSAWTNTSGGGTLLSTDFDGLGVKTLTAVHFPVEVDVAYADSKFSFTSGGKPVYNYYLYETGKAYTVDGANVTATLAMGKPAGFTQIHIAGIDASVADYTFGCSLIRPVACASVGTDGTITEDVLQAGARLSGVADADGGIFAGRLTSPDVAANYIFTLASDDNIYTLTRDSKTLTAGKMYNFPSPSVTGGSNWAVTAASDLYVDLGLSVKWAKCNVGASSATDYGNYYAWAEIQPKSNYDWSTNIYNPSGDGSTFTRYTGSDYSALLPEDDAAYSTMGGTFRSPTNAEWVELRDNCNLSKQTNYNGTGINGLLVTSRKVGYTDKSIFLPFAGNYGGETLSNASKTGAYWSSSLKTDEPANALYVSIGNSMDFSYIVRLVGLSVRPVSD
ncbi:MAG: hypothetical protein J5667_04565 [Bacteroidales bacterium]|nr:hypothetical protein [Bacteroidales bacterium]